MKKIDEALKRIIEIYEHAKGERMNKEDLEELEYCGGEVEQEFFRSVSPDAELIKQILLSNTYIYSGIFSQKLIFSFFKFLVHENYMNTDIYIKIDQFLKIFGPDWEEERNKINDSLDIHDFTTARQIVEELIPYD